MPTVLPEPDLRLVESRASTLAVVRIVRPTEWIILTFLLYAPLLTLVWPVSQGLSTRLMSVNLMVILLYAGLIFLDFTKPCLTLKQSAIGCLWQ